MSRKAAELRALLDVNVLIALHDRDHVHHGRASTWFAAHAEQGWASCPLTQNGLLRIMSQPAYPHAAPLAALTAMLGQSTGTRFHAFWPDDISVLDTQCIDQTLIHAHHQVTDAYLLALAVRHGGRLVSFDRRIPVQAVHGAMDEHLVVL